MNKVVAEKLSLPLADYLQDKSLIPVLLDRLEDLSMVLRYSTMKEGKRGHFITLSYLKSPYDSFYTPIEAEGESLSKALCLAITGLPEDWST